MWHVIIGVPDSTLAMFRERRVVGVVVKRWITGNICHSKLILFATEKGKCSAFMFEKRL